MSAGLEIVIAKAILGQAAERELPRALRARTHAPRMSQRVAGPSCRRRA
jgi:hypothetical protein